MLYFSQLRYLKVRYAKKSGGRDSALILALALISEESSSAIRSVSP